MSRSLDIDLLRTFVAIAETRTLGRAAARIGRTQAAVSMQVQKLEALLSQPLLNRTGRGVTLTLHGERLLGHARTLLRHHDAAVADITGAGLTGTLRFGCPDDYAAAFLPHILRSFAGRHPQVFVEVVCAPTPRLLAQLGQHALDLALISTTEGERSAAILRREPLVWVGNRHDHAATQEPLQLALSDPDTLDHRAARERLDAAGRPYRVAYASGSISGLLAVVRSGQAIAVLTQAAVPADLQVLPTDARLPPLPTVGLSVRFDLPRPPELVVEFAEHLQRIVPAL
ncbi:LysR family transcriptional regulator [Methylibium petroleiphilum]|uniref:Transcriptional regulator, LysR family n=1 Tax=Methylibium petroleiphilum (strain ATCC BAA-1232 / LMG 22953 / PM1) TaxID=420662 RepID=A2SFU0_METPP|nr:LysR family transcriptional regulator [Methylibium petroleiphilum]ABM94429.1 transcriptional regulator, LysR family [Methylibium petroleiphilum PM1]